MMISLLPKEGASEYMSDYDLESIKSYQRKFHQETDQMYGKKYVGPIYVICQRLVL